MGFDKIRIPKKAVIPIFGEYIVLVEKMSLISSQKMIYELGKKADVQSLIAIQICTLVSRSGLADTHFDNICMTTDGEIAIIDTDSLGGKNAGLMGLREIISLTGSSRRLKPMCEIAKRTLIALEASYTHCDSRVGISAQPAP